MNHTNIEIRFSDQDGHQHVHHEAMVAYIAHGRINFVDGILNDFGLVDTVDYILAKLSVEFLKPVTWPGNVKVAVYPEHIGTKSYILKYDITKHGDDEPFCKAETVTVFYDIATGESIPVPDVFKSK